MSVPLARDDGSNALGGIPMDGGGTNTPAAHLKRDQHFFMAEPRLTRLGLKYFQIQADPAITVKVSRHVTVRKKFIPH